MLKREQPESIEAYSAALRERLLGVLPPDKVEEVVAETESHLEERADELRRRADVYEKQAVAEFIPARKLAWGVNRAWAATYLRHGGTKWLQSASAALCALALLLFLAQFLIVSKLPLVLQNPRYVVNILFAAPVVIFLLALLACRPQLRRFTYGGLGVLALFTVLGGWLCTSGETGNVSRFDAPAHYKDTLALHTYQQQEARLLREGMRTYRTAFVQLNGRINRNIDLELLPNQEVLQFQRQNPAVTAEQIKRLQRDVMALRLNGTRYLWIRPTVKPSPSLMVGKDYLVPQKPTEQQGISAFRKLSPAAQWRVSTENTGLMNRNQALVTEWQKAEPESTASLTDAMVRWRTDAPKQLKMLQDYEAHRQKTLQRDMAMMASAKWRFDTAAARAIGTLGLYAVGALIAADTMGGFLGMFLLRNLRRRKLRQDKGLA